MTNTRLLHVGDKIIAEARAWIGTPYHHQAAVKGVGCDCLGLVRGVWRAVYGADPEHPLSLRVIGPRRCVKRRWPMPLVAT